jgi:hypothetical protein
MLEMFVRGTISYLVIFLLSDHYLGSTRELADAAIDKLIAWKKSEGIAV